MNRAETLRVMTLLAQITGPAPEGDAWDLTANAWAAVLADTPEADVLRAVKAYVTGGPGRAPGTWWPKPGELLALLRPAELTNEQAWTQIRPQLHASVDVEGLTPAQVSALGSLPDGFWRRRASSDELDKLRGRFLAACQAAETRAKAGTPATVTAFPRPAPPLRLAQVLDLERDEAAEFNRKAFAMMRKPVPTMAAEDRDPGWEARRRAEVAAQAEQLARRAGGGR